MTFRGFATFENLTVQAGEEVEINSQGSYIVCIESTLATFRIALDDDAASVFFAGAEVRLPDGDEFSKIRVINPNAGALTVSIGTAFGEFRDRRVNLSGSLSLSKATVFDSVADVNLPVSVATQVLAALSTRREAIIKNEGTTVLRIGDSNAGATRGVELQPGDAITLDTTEAIHAHNTDAVTAGTASAIWTAD